MSDLITRTARLVPYVKRPKQVPSFVTAYAYEPLADEPGAALGNLYVVIEVLVSGRASEEVADLVIETIGDRYYNQAPESASALERFEAAIKAANQELAEHVSRGNAAWIGKLSAVIAIHRNDELHLAQTGSAEAFLYRGKAASRINGNGNARPTTPSKTFGSIASGQLEAGDRLLLATPALIHQVPLTRLQNIISQAGPNAAIAEITDLLKGVEVDRIAALVIEMTTPELAALQVRSEQPDEIRLGSPENALEAAKMAATPLAQTTVTSSKKVVHAAQTGLQKAKPHAKTIALKLADWLGLFLASSRNRKLAAIVIVVVIIASIFGAFWHSSSVASTKIWQQYQSTYSTFSHAEGLLSNGDKTAAREEFVRVSHQLESLKGHQRTIDSRLKRAALPEGEPRSYSSLVSLAGDRIDQIDGLVKAQPTTVASLSAKGSKAHHFELSGDKAYVFDTGAHQLAILNVLTGQQKTSAADITKLGDIAATTLSGNNDGIYIATTKPAVWFYRFDNDTLTSQTIGFGQWAQAKAISSYGGNIYILTDKMVQKHVKTATGFSPKSDYLPVTSEINRDATALAVDGDVYLLSPSGLHRYVAGSLKQSATIPEALGAIENLRSVAKGSVLVGTSPSSGRAGLWVLKGNALEFSRQVSITGVTKLYDATFDNRSGNVYGLTDGRLIRFSTQP